MKGGNEVKEEQKTRCPRAVMCREFLRRALMFPQKGESEMSAGKFSRRDFLRGASALAVGGVLAACGAPPATEAPKAEATKAPEATATPVPAEPTPTPAPPKAEGALIRYWTGWGGTFDDAWNAMQQTEEFKAALGNNTFEIKNSVGGEAMLTAVAGGEPPDAGSNIQYLAFMARGVLLPIDDMVAASSIVKKEYFIEGIDPDVEKAVTQAIDLLGKWGAEVKRVFLPHTEYAVAIYYIIATAEASSNLARYDGVKYGLRSKGYRDLMEMYTQTRAKGFGQEVKRRIILGTYVLSAGYYEAYYRKASQVRTLMRKDFEDAFRQVDVILAPTAPTPAFRIGEKTEDPLQMYLSDIFTIPVNIAGIPGISIPCGFSRENLPIGLQMMGKHFDEGMLLRVAYAFEQNTDFHLKKPAPIV
jgi:hypothetical protein